MDQPITRDELARRRRSARRTALIVAVVAVGIYAAFILRGVLHA